MMGNHVIICSVWLFPSMRLPKNIVPQALAQYANWPALHECEVVWCPTAANHSGENIISFFFWKKNYLHIDNYSGKIIMKLLFMKTFYLHIRPWKHPTFTLDNLKCLLKGQPSDGAGGEFKRRIMSLALAGECKLSSKASDLHIIEIYKYI